MTASGYNPLRWNCEKSGCYNQTLRPRIEEFAECFPRRIGMSDVDGIVEIAGRFLLLEWKSAGGAVTTGQRIMFERMTSGNMDPHKFTVIVVSGHPREMQVESVQVFSAGKAGPVEACDLSNLKERIRAWVARAERAKVRPSRRDAA